MQLDSAKVKAKIAELNKKFPPSTWDEADGYHSLNSLECTQEKPTFLPNQGIPLKVFVNLTTGEIKLFNAKVFAADDAAADQK